jgi:Dual specificity phosphatase, catalytic domain
VTQRLQGPIPDSYWVVPGRVLAGEYPGAATDDSARAKLALFRDVGIDCYVDLTEEGEYALRPYAAIVREAGCEHRRFSIRDLGCPTVDEMRAVLDAIDDAVSRQRKVYVHCYGGIGRTGTVVGCFLVRHGLAPRDALATIACWREGTPDGDRSSPENEEQEEFILTWPEPTWAARGSQLQMQLYVNRHSDLLTATIFERVADLRERATSLDWRAPLAPRLTEPQDAAFLHALDLDHLAPRLTNFWPARGPVWDALAVVELRGGHGALLVEAKSHPAEIYGGGSQAGATGTEKALAARAKIERALIATQRALGLRERDAGRWMKPLRPNTPGHSSVYQTANRYAHLVWLREQGVETWLVHLLVVEDPTFEPTTRAEWEQALPLVERDLGLEGVTVPGSSHVFIQGLGQPG